MHIEYPIDLIHRDGSIFRLDTPEAASGYRHAFGAKHRVVTRRVGDDGAVTAFEHNSAWIARDALGRTVHPDDIPPAARRSWWIARIRRAQAAAERGLPIPGTGAARRRVSRSRHGRHAAETRVNRLLRDDLDDAGLPGRRVCRKRAVGPIPYDEPCRHRPQRCWKKQRRTRWKS